MPITSIFLEPQGLDRQDQVLRYNIDFDQNIDHRTGRPVGHPLLNEFTVHIIRDSDSAAPFYVEWQLDPTKQETLDIGFYDNNRLVRTIKIKNAYLIGYNQGNSQPGTIEETLVFSPESMELDDTLYDREDFRK
jgi:hypothetical protein